MPSFCSSNCCRCNVAGGTPHITFFMDATISTLWTRSGLFFLLLQQQFCVSRYSPETVVHATKVLTLCFKLDWSNWNFWPFRRNMADSTEPSMFCFQFWNLVAFFATPSTTPALFGGGLLGYVMYDCTHYYLHHGQPSTDPAKHLKVRT
jgi:hypothetical protein